MRSSHGLAVELQYTFASPLLYCATALEDTWCGGGGTVYVYAVMMRAYL